MPRLLCTRILPLVVRGYQIWLQSCLTGRGWLGCIRAATFSISDGLASLCSWRGASHFSSAAVVLLPTEPGRFVKWNDRSNHLWGILERCTEYLLSTHRQPSSLPPLCADTAGSLWGTLQCSILTWNALPPLLTLSCITLPSCSLP